MTEGVSASEDAAAARAAEQARIRKERREAKIRAGGSARLNKITGVGGGYQEPESAPSTTPVTPAKASEAHADPEEVDISVSEHFYTPQTTRRVPPPVDPNSMSEDQLRQMMLGFDPSAGGPGANPFMGAGAGGPPGSMDEDPMMKMLNQMMSGAGMGGLPGMGGAGGPPGMPGMPANPFAPQPAAVPDRSASLWRLAHFAVAMMLGLYIALWTPFTGTKSEREAGALEHELGHVTAQDLAKEYFFYVFATAEAVLLTSRWFLDKGRAPPGGIIQTVLGFIPEPTKGYLQIGMRYMTIFSTVRADILVSIFVMGVVAWLRGN